MTDNDIMKALQCVAKNDRISCIHCDYNKFPLSQCRRIAADDAIRLIVIQKREIERLEAEIERLKVNIVEAHIDIKEHMAEIERLKVNKVIK